MNKKYALVCHSKLPATMIKVKGVPFHLPGNKKNLGCVEVHSPVESGLCNILKFPVQQLSTKLVKFMHTSV